MSDRVTAVVFEGSRPQSPVEEMMTRVRGAATLDNLVKLAKVSALERVVLHTNRTELVKPSQALGAEVYLNDTDPRDFHYGKKLQAVIDKYGLSRVLCLNGAGCPLIKVSELEMICEKLLSRDNFVYANNIQSADLVAFTVPPSLCQTALPATDNSLAMILRDQSGLEMALMPHSLGLLFDIDTPADLLVLGAGPYAGRHTRAALDDLGLDYTVLEAAKAVLGEEYRDVALVGRVGAPVIERLNALLKLRLRVFSEERGMKSLGRIETGSVISLLGLLIEQSGLEYFFDCLAKVASCAFIDSRVLFYHHGYRFSDRERFLSDLGLWREIENPWLRRFTRAAVDCPLPVMLGGHSLVSGSLWALTCELDPGRPGLSS